MCQLYVKYGFLWRSRRKLYTVYTLIFCYKLPKTSAPHYFKHFYVFRVWTCFTKQKNRKIEEQTVQLLNKLTVKIFNILKLRKAYLTQSLQSVKLVVFHVSLTLRLDQDLAEFHQAQFLKFPATIQMYSRQCEL